MGEPGTGSDAGIASRAALAPRGARRVALRPLSVVGSFFRVTYWSFFESLVLVCFPCLGVSSCLFLSIDCVVFFLFVFTALDF